MVAAENYYQVLGVNPQAELIEIKKAFKKKALTCHPDLHPHDPQAEERFKVLARAYQVLEDPESRRKYDQQEEKSRQNQAKNTQTKQTQAKQAPSKPSPGPDKEEKTKTSTQTRGQNSPP